MKVIILAGGRGTRLPESARDLPKPLVPIGAKPILAHQIDALTKQGFKDIRLSLGHRALQIVEWLKNYRPETEYVIETEPRGTGGGIKFAAQDIREPFMVVNGDIVADFDFKKMKREAHTSGKNIITGWHLPDAREYGLLDVHRNGNIRAFLEKPKELKSGFINAGVYVLTPETLATIPERGSIEHEVFPVLAREGKLKHVAHSGTHWFDCGTESRLEEVRRFLNAS